MTLIPTIRCRDMQKSVAFYTGVLDFECVGTWSLLGPSFDDPCYAVLTRDGGELHLSSHAGDGVFGQAVVVLTPDVDALFQTFVRRGLDRSAKPQSPVHQGPTDQSWGTREIYVDDPDGNTLRFMQR